MSTETSGSNQRARHPATDPIRGGFAVPILVVVVVVVSLAALGLVAGAGAKSTVSSGASSFVATGGPTLKVTPNSAAEGKSVIVTGSGYPASSTAYLTLEDPALPSFNLTGSPYPYNTASSVSVSATGTLSFSYRVIDINPGVYSLHLLDGTISKHASFTVTSPSAGVTFSTNVTSVAPGGLVKLTGTDFYPMDYENFYLSWHNAQHFKILKAFPDNMNGAFNRTWHVPTTYPAGTYLIIVVGDTYGTGVGQITIS
jgi:hypothetical protein